MLSLAAFGSAAPLAAIDLFGYLGAAGAIAMAALGLGFVIFVHELGHFVVAKLCGVRCDRFFVGFDVPFGKMINQALGREGEFKLFGLPIPRTVGPMVKVGETTYGIGIVPLGGYVMMLGQTDDPGNYAEEIERSKALEGAANAKQIVGPKGETLWVDRRSYRAKSVPQRMAIISAGVVMNLISGFLFAWLAFAMGAPKVKCDIGASAPGSAAWEANLRTGDKVLKIGETENPTFDDLMGEVPTSDMNAGIPFVVQRYGSSTPETMILKPRQKPGQLPRIGLALPVKLRLGEKQTAKPFTPADDAKPALEPGDEIVEVDGQPVADYRQYHARMGQRADREVILTVQRGGEAPKDDPFGPRQGGTKVQVTIRPNPVKHTGVLVDVGPIAAVQPGSPAEEAGLKVGDRLVRVDGAADWDVTLLEDQLRPAAQSRRPVTLQLERDGAPLEVTLTPRIADWIDTADPSGVLKMGVPSLGIAVEALFTVRGVSVGSAAEAAGVLPGDKLLKAELVSDNPRFEEAGKVLDFGPTKYNWLVVVLGSQSLPPQATINLTVERGGQQKTFSLEPRPLPDTYSLERGLALQFDREMRYAQSLGEGAKLAWGSLVRSMGQVYGFLRKIGGQVPVTGLAGPISIAGIAYSVASDGLSSLLLFLTMLSANLAVINFLPIPVLDGGHMVFLAYEGVRGRPADERFMNVMHLLGAAMLLSLMVLVFGIDIGRLLGFV